MNKYFSLLLLALLIFNTNSNAQYKKIPSEKPKLIVGIVVSHMRYDYINRYYNKLSENGIKKLVSEGTSCKNASFNYMFTQNSVGNTTIATGTYPRTHGIVSDKWYNRLSNKIEDATDDEKFGPVGGSFELGMRSPQNILSTTFSDQIKLSNGNKSKTIGVSLLAENALIPVGHNADAAYWFDTRNGTWMTSTFYADSLKKWVVKFNNKNLSDIYLDYGWETMLPISEYTESNSDDTEYELGYNSKITFPYSYKQVKNKSLTQGVVRDVVNTITNNKIDYSVLLRTPFGNTLTTDFALHVIENDSLGLDDNVDFLSINYASSAEITKAFGSLSVENEDMFLRLDSEIERLLNYIDEFIGKENVLVYFTSDHGVALPPAEMKRSSIPAGVFDHKRSIALLKSYLNIIYGQGNWVSFYQNRQIYLNQELIEESGLDLEKFEDKIVRFMQQFTGISDAVSASTILKNGFPEGINVMIQRGYYPKRSGDIVLVLDPGWVEVDNAVTASNSAYSYDTNVPLVWYGWRIGRSKIIRDIDMVDVAPTISFFLDIAEPNASVGDPIYELLP